MEAFLIEIERWDVRWFVVDTANWWPGRMVIILPRWITAVDFDEETVHVDLTRERVETSPEYKPSQIVAPDYEERLHRHYHRQTDQN